MDQNPAERLVGLDYGDFLAVISNWNATFGNVLLYFLIAVSIIRTILKIQPVSFRK